MLKSLYENPILFSTLFQGNSQQMKAETNIIIQVKEHLFLNGP